MYRPDHGSVNVWNIYIAHIHILMLLLLLLQWLWLLLFSSLWQFNAELATRLHSYLISNSVQFGLVWFGLIFDSRLLFLSHSTHTLSFYSSRLVRALCVCVYMCALSTSKQKIKLSIFFLSDKIRQ